MLSNLTGLFLLIGVGFFAVRAGVVPGEISKPLSSLLIKITTPATVFCAMLRPYDPDFLRLGGVMVLLSVALLPPFAALCVWLSRALRVPEGRRGMWSCCATFCNNGFMGYPVALALFGEEGLSLTVIMSIPFSFLLFTLGTRMVCMDRATDGGGLPVSWGGILLSPINAAMAAGLAVYFTQLQLPQPVLTPLEYLANVTTPLSMLVVGMNLSQGRLTEMARDRDALTASAARLLLCPLLSWAVLRLIPGLDSLVFGVFLINMAMPAATMATFLAEEHGGCTQLGARTVFLSSLLCIVTIPLVSLLL